MPISAKHLNYFPFQCATCRETIQKHLGVTKEYMDLHMSNHHNGSNLFWNFWPKITEQCNNLPIQRTPLNNSTSTENIAQNSLGLAQVKQENDNVIVTEEDCETVAKPNLEKLSQTMMDLELPLCNSPQNMQNKKVHKKIKQICLRVPTNCLDSLCKQFGQFIISEEQSETSEQSTLEWSSSLSDEEYVRQTKSDPEPAMNRMSAVRKSLLASINSKSQLPNLSSSDSENEKPTAQKAYRKSKNTKAAAKNIEARTQNFIPKKTQIGSFVFSDSSSDESFVEFRQECQTSNTEYALQCKQSQQEKNTLEGKDTASPKTEEGSNPLNANNGKLLEKMVDPAKPTSEISGSHDEKEADKIEAARWASYWKYWR